MYAIVDIKDKQFKVSEGDTLYVPHLQTAADEEITFDRVLLAENGEGVQVGTPHLNGASVSATVLDHVRGDKVTVFKKKRRKRYRVKRGHRQQYTQIRVEAVDLSNGVADNNDDEDTEEKETAEA